MAIKNLEKLLKKIQGIKANEIKKNDRGFYGKFEKFGFVLMSEEIYGGIGGDFDSISLVIKKGNKKILELCNMNPDDETYFDRINKIYEHLDKKYYEYKKELQERKIESEIEKML